MENSRRNFIIMAAHTPHKLMDSDEHSLEQLKKVIQDEQLANSTIVVESAEMGEKINTMLIGMGMQGSIAVELIQNMTKHKLDRLMHTPKQADVESLLKNIQKSVDRDMMDEIKLSRPMVKSSNKPWYQEFKKKRGKKPRY